jgi:hypothetical protein
VAIARRLFRLRSFANVVSFGRGEEGVFTLFPGEGVSDAIFMLGVTGDVLQDRLLTAEVLIEEHLFVDDSIIVDSGEFVVGFDSRSSSVSLMGFNSLLSSL